MDAYSQLSWPLWRALLTGVLGASVCVGVWVLVGVPDPAAPIVSGCAALVATTWGAFGSGSRGIFVLLVCLESTLVVASMAGGAMLMVGAPFFFVGALFFTIRVWMKNEGFV